MTLAWSPESKQRAKEKGRHLLKLHLQGRHADGASWEFAGDIDEDTVGRVKALIAHLTLAQVNPLLVVHPNALKGITSPKLRSVFVNEGVHTVAQLIAMTTVEFLKVPNVGRSDLKQVRQALTAANLHLADDPPPKEWDVKRAKAALLPPPAKECVICPKCGCTTWVGGTDSDPRPLCEDCGEPQPDRVLVASLPGLWVNLVKRLTENGVTTLDRLTKMTEEQVLAIHGINRKGLARLKSGLKERGLALAKIPTCSACHCRHPESVMCPPHEVR